MKKLILAAALITALLLVFTGCSNANPGVSASPSASASASASNEVVNPSPSPTVSTVKVTVKGSDFVSDMVTVLGTSYNESNSGVTVDTAKTNSNTAIASVADGNADIALSSRPLKAEEKTLFPNLKENLICIDGLVVVVSKDCSVSSLTAQQIKDIFLGSTKNWKDVGGTDGEIQLYVMGTTTEIRNRFNEQFLGVDDKGTQNDTDEVTAATDYVDMIDKVGSDPLAIGYLPLSAITSDSKVKPLTIDAVLATNGNVKSGSYIYVLKYFMITNNPSAEAQAFVDYCMGAEAQASITGAGLNIPLKLN